VKSLIYKKYYFSKHKNLCLILTYLCSTVQDLIYFWMEMPTDGKELDNTNCTSQYVRIGHNVWQKASLYHLNNVMIKDYKSFYINPRFCGKNEKGCVFHWSMISRLINIWTNSQYLKHISFYDKFNSIQLSMRMLAVRPQNMSSNLWSVCEFALLQCAHCSILLCWTNKKWDMDSVFDRQEKFERMLENVCA